MRNAQQLTLVSLAILGLLTGASRPSHGQERSLNPHDLMVCPAEDLQRMLDSGDEAKKASALRAIRSRSSASADNASDNNSSYNRSATQNEAATAEGAESVRDLLRAMATNAVEKQQPVPQRRQGPAQVSYVEEEVVQYAIDQAHAGCFEDDPYPSATKCQKCHPGHYREWSVSSHAYAQLSPIFNAMSNKLNEQLNGTLGDFCIRCHTPVGMALCEPLNMPNADRHPAAREGITCVVCHRINQSWGKGSGRQALVKGGLQAPIYGPLGGDILAQVLADPDEYGVLKTTPDDEIRGRDIHRNVVPSFYLTTSSFCGACHDVFAPNGFRLEDAFSEFKASPAAKEKHQSCQDCHMGLEPGVASGYACAPAAKVGNAFTPPRKRTNHMFVGPDYSIIHPGIYPHNPAALKEEHEKFRQLGSDGLATIREWLEFDEQSGWGTRNFEHNLPKGFHPPEAWKDQEKRYQAREILDGQIKLLQFATSQRRKILGVGYRLGEIETSHHDSDGIEFKVQVYNGTDGHGVPTGFDAERLVFLRVTLFDATGKVVFVSGDLDPNGDVRDSHSVYVHNGLLPHDHALFSLQSKFITRNIRGGEREQVLNVPFSLDPLPYNRPDTRPFTVLGRPIGARKHKQIIEPCGERWAKYHIPECHLTGHGPYQARVQIIAGMVPVNLIHAISSVGFDYDLSAREIAERVVSGHLVIHEKNIQFPLHSY